MTYLLSTRFSYNVNDELVFNTIRWWIQNHPLIIYKHVYKADANKLKRISLNKQAHAFLMKEMADKYPSKKATIGLRKKNLMLSKKYRIQSKTEY